jgi:hypothetical protein
MRAANKCRVQHNAKGNPGVNRFGLRCGKGEILAQLALGMDLHGGERQINPFV